MADNTNWGGANQADGQTGRTEYSSKETLDGREGFTGGENVANRQDFAGRENVAEERQDRALDPDDPVSQS